MTLSGVSHLLAHYCGISTSPRVITNSAPHIIEYTHLHSAFIGNVTSHQLQLSSCAWSCVKVLILEQ